MIFLKKLVRRIIGYRFIIYWSVFRAYFFGEQEIRILKTLITPGKAAVDVGAHIGIYTWFLSRYCDYVHAFEPHPESFKRLKGGALGNVALYNIALSDKTGNAELFVSTSEEEDTALGTMNDLNLDARVKKYVIHTATLDSFNLKNIGFIKIDVEGHEAAVLEGGIQTIARERPVILVEIEQRHMSMPISDVINRFLILGYDGYFYSEGGLKSVEEFSYKTHQEKYLDNPHSQNYINNFIFKPKRS